MALPPSKRQYAVVELTTLRLPGKATRLPATQRFVTGARAAAQEAAKLARTAPTNTTRYVSVIDPGSRRDMMICHGPAILGMRSKRSAKRSFAQCQIIFEPFKKAVRSKPKKRRK